jgi:PAS domain-containing protein
MVAVGAAGVGAVLAVWSLIRERERTIARRGAEEAQLKFVAAAEASLDAFSLLDSVRDKSGRIVDFRIQYLNANAQKLTGRPRAELVGQSLCDAMPILKATSLFNRCCKVVETGEPLNQEYPVPEGNLLQATWVRYQVIKLGDGLAITCSDVSEAKANQERYEQLAEFTDSVIQNAPFSIIATDVQGKITAMNVAAEKLSGYSREELVG